MKVVLFCGGLGMRLRDYSEKIPKPMVPIGYRPIIWHIMKYYAHFGFTDFILCLGYKADMFKEYFVNYDEYLSNDFVLSQGGKKIELHNTDIKDWTITFVDTGVHANIGSRLRSVRHLLGDDEVFMAHYTDTLTNLHLPDMLEYFYEQNKIASFLAANPTQSFHVAQIQSNGIVDAFVPLSTSGYFINGGFFILRKEIFDYMEPGEELVLEPFARLIDEEQLIGYQYDGFWATMDTFKEKMFLDDLFAQGNPPWAVWEEPKMNDSVEAIREKI